MVQRDIAGSGWRRHQPDVLQFNVIDATDDIPDRSMSVERHAMTCRFRIAQAFQNTSERGLAVLPHRR